MIKLSGFVFLQHIAFSWDIFGVIFIVRLSVTRYSRGLQRIMIKKCGRLIVAPASQKHKCASSLHFIYFFCSSFALFHLVGSCFICVLLSIAREPSWLIANAIIALKTARHVGTESRKYAKLAPDRGKKHERSVFQNYALVILDPHTGVLIMHDAFNFDRSAQY